MQINLLSDLERSESLTDLFSNQRYVFPKEEDGREVFIAKLAYTQITGISKVYPNALLRTHTDKLYLPLQEQFMSLGVGTWYEQNGMQFEAKEAWNPAAATLAFWPVFFFIYDTTNYYHFIYDTLPYLWGYFELKKHIPNLKLLMNSQFAMGEGFYVFVVDALSLLGIDFHTDVTILSSPFAFTTMYIASSLTHGGASNTKPNRRAYEIWARLASTISRIDAPSPKRFYVSRRTSECKDVSNIGSNYTTKRVLACETELVKLLAKHGYVEVFCETMSISEKLRLFRDAERVIGAIGGGLCHGLFAGPNTKLLCIVSPHFLDINSRFVFSLGKDVVYYRDTEVIPLTEESSLYMRIKLKADARYGEIIAYDKLTELFTLSMGDETTRGFRANAKYEEIKRQRCEFEIQDKGLNSPWNLDLRMFEAFARLTGFLDCVVDG